MSANRSKDSISISSKSYDKTSSSIQSDISLTSLKTLREELSQYITRECSIIGTSPSEYPGIERASYDFAVDRHNPYATNLLEAMSYLVKGCLGIGIFNMHTAFMYGGMLASALGSVAVGFLLSLTMCILVNSAQKMYLVLRVSRLSYADLCEAAVATGPCMKLRRYSKIFRYALELFVFLQMTGTCSIYQIIIANTIKTLTEFISNVHLSLRMYIFMITIPLLLICLIRKWKYLAPISIVADLFLAICIITTMFYSLSEADNLRKRPLWKSVPGLFKFFGICLYSMDGFPLMLPIENNMRSPHHVRFVIHCGMAIVFLAVTFTGFCGYWGWGEGCKSPITIHMPFETIPMILQFLVAVMLAGTFAIQFWVPFRIVWHYVGKSHGYGFSRRNRWERFYRILYLLFITCLSIVVPKTENLMVFLGSFFVSLNAFVFPSLIETLVVWRRYRKGQTRWAVIKDCFICILGVIFCIGGMYSLYV